VSRPDVTAVATASARPLIGRPGADAGSFGVARGSAAAGPEPLRHSTGAATAPCGFAIRQLGLTAYEPTWRAMQAFTAARDQACGDELWVTEHLPVYTLGIAGRLAHLRAPNAIPVLRVDRGGQLTYHGPGQLVVYVLCDIQRRRLSVRATVRALEAAVVSWLADLDIAAHGSERAPGVYVRDAGGEAKIAALGLRISRGATYHGVAVNLDMDLGPFAAIDPCGYPGLRVAQVADFHAPPPVAVAGATLAARIAGVLGGARP
jgi:lipoyl(octanoyl) transferase